MLGQSDFTLENPMTRNRNAGAALALAGIVMLAPSARAQSLPCKTLAESMTNNVLVPYHAYITSTAGYNGGKPTQSEVISTGNAMYSLVHGKWQRSPVDPKEIAKMQREGADSMVALYTCSRAGSETVNGVPTQRYHIERKTPDEDGDTGKQDIWIDSKGLIRQAERDRDVGGAAMKSHVVMRYDYTNVSAPPGVQ
jgi:hypothetical protein